MVIPDVNVNSVSRPSLLERYPSLHDRFSGREGLLAPRPMNNIGSLGVVDVGIDGGGGARIGSDCRRGKGDGVIEGCCGCWMTLSRFMSSNGILTGDDVFDDCVRFCGGDCVLLWGDGGDSARFENKSDNGSVSRC